jgi:soluble epoxide hydrolase/lipid-phosphate phosphatase
MAPLLPNKTYNIPTTGHKYAYISYPPSNPSKPTLLFLHGFPSTSHDWRFQILHFRSLGYGILAPDLLGYGGTDKPKDVNCYVGSEMSKEIIAILDHEGLGPKGQGGSNGVIAIAHDWGTYLLSQLASRYQYRFEKFVFMSVPYTIPGRRTDVDLVNRKTKERLGYEMMGYFLFLASARAGKVLGENVCFMFLSHHQQRSSSLACCRGKELNTSIFVKKLISLYVVGIILQLDLPRGSLDLENQFRAD